MRRMTLGCLKPRNLPEAGRATWNWSFPGAFWGRLVLPTTWFQTFGLQHCEAIKSCCSKLSSLGYFVIATPPDYYSKDYGSLISACLAKIREFWLNWCCNHRSQKNLSWARKAMAYQNGALANFFFVLRYTLGNVLGLIPIACTWLSGQECDQSIQPFSAPLLLWKRTTKSVLTYRMGLKHP